MRKLPEDRLGSVFPCLALRVILGEKAASRVMVFQRELNKQQGKLSHIINLVSPGTQFNISNKVEMLS